MEFVPDALVQLTSGGSWVAPMAALLGAFVFGQLLAWTYERTYTGLSYSRGFSHTLVLVSISASILVLAMSHSIFAGLGLFGVLSMIRFRTDLKTSRDLVFVMSAACIGVACGVGAWLVSFLGAALISLVALYLSAGPFGSRTRFDGVLRFRMHPIQDSESEVSELLDQFCRRNALLSSTEQEDGLFVEHIYQVKFFSESDRNQILDALKERVHAKDTRLMLQDSSTEY